MVAFMHSVVVEGKCPFPTDMLRCDRLAPDTSDDVNAILMEASDFFALKAGPLGKPVRITLVRCWDKAWKPTTGRWESFGWRVVDHTSWRA